jgi:hypothetical protein
MGKRTVYRHGWGLEWSEVERVWDDVVVMMVGQGMG